MLAQDEAAGYLIERGLLSPAAVVDGGLVIRDVSSRNRNFLVETRDGPSYLLKQGLGADGVATVTHEASVYAHLAGVGEVDSYLPGYHSFDPEHALLILDLIAASEDLRTHHMRLGAFPAGAGEALGRALGTLHLATRETYPATAAPWVLSVHMPDVSVFREISAANVELIKIVQASDAFGDALDELREGWSATALIHHDVKWDNCLVNRERPDELHLVDWEVAMAGDPCWDLGSAISHYLSYWLFSIPVTGIEPPARFPALAAYPLDSMKPAIQACWVAYAGRLGLDASAELAWQQRVVAYAGARLVQTAFEACQFLPQLTSSAVLHLQLAANILQRPQVAAAQLLELPRVQASA
jgi:aminoglycoside phosphotransferase (APT) family kinase protein